MLLSTIQITITSMTGTHSARHGQLNGQNFWHIKSSDLSPKQTIQGRNGVYVESVTLCSSLVAFLVSKKQIQGDTQRTRIFAANDAGQFG